MKLLSTIAVLCFIALPLNAATVQEAAPEIVGGWRLEFTMPDGEQRHPIVLVGRQHDELVAWYVAGRQPEAFSDVKLDGEQLRMTIRPEEFGGEVKATLVAHLTVSDASAGTIKYADNSGDSGQIACTGKRIDVSEFEDTETWKIGFIDPDGIRHDGRVTVIPMGDDLFAWYSSDDYELPAKKMTVNGDQVEMSISTKTAGGEKVDVTFRGVMAGRRTSGTAHWSVPGDSGSFRFSATRES